ncbi:internalin, putative [Fulvivirga imtechensis AK7]|uniref:Internalin, putative n=1 Tax=Fulvivirga imtechensis AK7 TaxID=1237149 RepID=L8JTZ4_9BACT|nr:T9SS type A sorting domain-containing protein [Fulvivirga imtechensis]ELR71019.1 internalin, putative [Fulvivirga imtechensis AK7]
MQLSIWKCLVLSWLCLYSTYSFAHLPAGKDCGESCFSTEVVNITQTESGCLQYSLRIINDGNCVHALSHYTVGVPCGDILSVSNSRGWKQEIGLTDPTTGIYGFKIDDISDFGEDGLAGEFTVDFIVCSNDSCGDSLDCWSPQVAYKAGQCIYREQTEVVCSHLSAHIETQDINCFGEATGSATVIIDDGQEPFTYQWSNGGSDQTISGVVAGEYSVTITDATGESLNLSALINQAASMEVVLDVADASCGGKNDGSASVTVIGGTTPYTYAWSNGATTGNIDGVGAGYYELVVTDAVGCKKVVPVSIENITTIEVSALSTPTGCAEANGSLDLTVSGGTAPYAYAWSNGSTSEDIDALGAGVYQVQVTDANGCSVSRSFIVKEENPLKLTAVTTRTSCVENNSGAIDLTVSGGSGVYTYLWSNGATTEDIQNLAAGFYTVTVTDTGGCQATLRISIVAETFQVSSNTQDPSCHGTGDGFIQVAPLGGTAPYSYLWSTGSMDKDLTGLTSGIYNVTITDAAGCSRKLYFVLNDPAGISATAVVNNANCEIEGFSLDLSVTGGAAPYVFAWSNGATSEDVSGLAIGDYTVEITDSNGCSTSHTYSVDPTLTECTDLTDPNEGTDDGSDDGTDNGSDDGTDDGSDTGDDNGSDDGSGGDDGTGGNDGSSDDDDDSGDGSGDGGDGSDGDGSDSGDDDGASGDGDSGGGGTGGDGNGCYDPFETEVVLVSVEGNCYTYSATISYDGQHVHGLSHVSFGLECGTIEALTNSENWKMEFGTDPTTGLSGFKIDDIGGFGEGGMPEEFDIEFTICTDNADCASTLSEMNFTVGYKYGGCVSYDEVSAKQSWPEAEVLAYPNPFMESTTIRYAAHADEFATVDVYNGQGRRIGRLYEGMVKKGVTYSFIFDATKLPDDIYTYKITTHRRVNIGKIIKRLRK